MKTTMTKKKQKKPRLNTDLASLPIVLSFGWILQYFPEFLLQILPYITDRRVWNAIIHITTTAWCDMIIYISSELRTARK